MKICEDLDQEAATLTETLHEKQQRLKALEEEAEKKKKYRDLLGSNNVLDVSDQYEAAKRSKERMNAKLALLDRDIETQRAELEQLQANENDVEPGTVEDLQNPSDNHAAEGDAADN